MNKKILVFHTSFQDQYANNLKNPIKNNKLFGLTEPIAFLNPKQFPVTFNYESTQKTDFDFEVIIISDNLFGNKEDYKAGELNINQKKVFEILNSFVEPSDDLYLYYHKRPQFSDTIRPFFEKYFAINLKIKEGFSHLANRESPFYTLVELINCTNKEDYKEILSRLRQCLDSDEKIQANQERNVLQTLTTNLKSDPNNYNPSQVKIADKHLANINETFNSLHRSNFSKLLENLQIIISNI